MSAGVCQKLHCDKMKEEYQKSNRFERMGYEEDYLAFLQKIQSDMERKIRRNRQRLELTQPNGQVSQISVRIRLFYSLIH